MSIEEQIAFEATRGAMLDAVKTASPSRKLFVLQFDEQDDLVDSAQLGDISVERLVQVFALFLIKLTELQNRKESA